MNTKAVVLACAVALIAAPLPAAAEVRCAKVKLKCGGFEPSWNFELAEDGTLKFTDPENPDWETRPLTVKACARVAGKGFTIEAGAPLDLSVKVTQERCHEENGDVHPYSMTIRYTSGATGPIPYKVSGTGCCRR